MVRNVSRPDTLFGGRLKICQVSVNIPIAGPHSKLCPTVSLRSPGSLEWIETKKPLHKFRREFCFEEIRSLRNDDFGDRSEPSN